MVVRPMYLMGILACGGLYGCPGTPQRNMAVTDVPGDQTTALDVGVDAQADAGMDAQADMGADGGTDAQPDALMDGGMDVQPDVPPVMAVDVQPDIQPDVPPSPPDSPALTFTFVGAALNGGNDAGVQLQLQMGWTGTLRGSTDAGPGGTPITFEGTIR